MAKERKPNLTWIYTSKFVQEFLGEELDTRVHGKHMRNMKKFINPEDDQPAITGDDVLGCLRAMKAGLFGWDGVIDTVWCITYGDPPYFRQYFEWVKEPPSWYEPHLVQLWEKITGKTAYPETPSHAIIAFLPTRPV